VRKSPLPQPHAGRIAICKFDAGLLEGALDSGDGRAPWLGSSALELPNSSNADLRLGRELLLAPF
jgi:hypothetical protein